VFNFEQTNPIQPLKLRLSYLIIFAISSAGSGLLSFSCVLRRHPLRRGAILPSEQINANGLGLPWLSGFKATWCRRTWTLRQTRRLRIAGQIGPQLFWLRRGGFSWSRGAL